MKHSVFLLNCHIVFCPKRRRKILVGPIRDRLMQIVRDTVPDLECGVLALEVMPDHVHLFLSATPQWAPNQRVGRIKGKSARLLPSGVPGIATDALGVDAIVLHLDGGERVLRDYRPIHCRTGNEGLTCGQAPQSPPVPDEADRRSGARPQPCSRCSALGLELGLARKREHYGEFGKTLAYHAPASELTALKTKPETAWLKDTDSQALQQVLKDLDQAFVNFFEKRARFPRFKSKRRDKARFRIPSGSTCRRQGLCAQDRLGQGSSRLGMWRRPPRAATFRREANGKWYVSLVVEFEMPDTALPMPDPENVVGIDLGAKGLRHPLRRQADARSEVLSQGSEATKARPAPRVPLR